MNQSDRFHAAKWVTLLGAVLNAFLGILKMVTGSWFHSQALFADGIHSLADLITDAMVLWASHVGSARADHSHPYGHERIETAATLLLSLFLVLVGAGIIWEGIHELLEHQIIPPQKAALWIALISICINEFSFRFTKLVAVRIKSELLLANAWHHRSDAGSSLVVVIGLLGALAGYAYLDGLASIFVGATIIHMGLTYGWNSIKELVDTGVDESIRQQISEIIIQTPGVQRIHQLRNRSMGGHILVDVHILVHSYLSVSEGHYIAQQVHQRLVKEIPLIRDVTVHVDPEDDELIQPSYSLPNRHIIEKNLLHPWQEKFPEIQSWVIHYLDGKINIDLYCDTINNSSLLKEYILEDKLPHDYLHKVRVFYLYCAQ
ncbi:MAG: cation diffusion facilitator family transporter [Legionellaceae bacterium]|nr:cation diffusion facilitator family transporter [Legionellaceae bacterium]